MKIRRNMNSTIIPIFYACDDNFVKFTVVSIFSLKQNASKEYKYRIYVLNMGITEKMTEKLRELEDDNFSIILCDVSDYLVSISEKLPIRDYYSKTTYYRMFISEMFPEYDKAIYIDSDTVVQGDVSELFLTDIGDSYVGACHEQAMVQVNEYGKYAESVVGISRNNYFNAGMILINCDMFRQRTVLDKFIHYLGVYDFVVTQDEDYLNLICKDHVYWLDQRWNTEGFGEIPYPIEEAKIIHYIMVSKPWHYADCRFGDIFWNYARQTSVCDDITEVLNSYTDDERENDNRIMENLVKLAVAETEKEDNFLNIINSTERSKDRVDILKKIEEYERDGRFDEDVEDDPPSRMLMPDEIEYYKKGISQRFKTGIAFMAARRFVNQLIDDNKLIIKEIRGKENLRDLQSGAIITCNHFNAFDSFAIQLAYESADKSKRNFYRVIKEGNYTSFPGFYGFLMRNCNTLPLSSNVKTLKKFMEASDRLLKEENFILVYPEQSMWWNYRKPKPLKKGAFIMACRNNVPVVPCFITMRDTDIMGEDGFFVQEYTVHIEKPIYPDPDLSNAENVNILMEKNFELWKNIYEREYGEPLTYITANAIL